MSTEEPADGSIVGWGTPINGCFVRADQFTGPDDAEGARWYPADDRLMDGQYPMTWEALCDHAKGGQFFPEPYLLTPSSIEPS